MATTLTTTRQSYLATVDLAFDCNGTRETIESDKIIYIMIEHDYDNQVLPVIYVSMAVRSDLYTKMMDNTDTAKFYLRIDKQNKNSTASISQKTIEGSFSYLPSNTNPNFQEDLSSEDTTILNDTYKKIMLGLVSVELTNALRKSFNGIYSDIDQKTLVAMALEGTSCVVESLAYNEHFDSILIPPISSRYQLIKYVFDQANFYDTNFRYFMDFENSYLTSKCGNATDAGDGQLDSVIVDVRAVTEEEAYYTGIEIKNGSYYIYVNPADTNVSLNQGTEKVANQIIGVDNDSTVQTLDLNINSTEDSDTKQTFVRTDNAALYKNELETNSVNIEIVKQDIDGSCFTPNKCIVVNNYGDYSQYNGKYILSYKREFYRARAGEFVMSCNVGLRAVGNITPAKSESSSKSYGYSSSSSTKTTTSSKKSTTTTISAAGNSARSAS